MSVRQVARKNTSRQRRRKVIAELEAFKRRAESACSTFENVDQWYQFVEHNLKPLLERDSDVLTDDERERVLRVTQLVDDTRESVSTACKALQHELQFAIDNMYVPAGVPVALIVVGVVGVATVAAVGYGVAKQVITPDVHLTLTNSNCRQLTLGGGNLVPGVAMPTLTLGTGGSTAMDIPAMSGYIEPGADVVKVRFLALTGSFDFPKDVTSFSIRNKLGESRTITVSTVKSPDPYDFTIEKSPYAVSINCN